MVLYRVHYIVALAFTDKRSVTSCRAQALGSEIGLLQSLSAICLSIKRYDTRVVIKPGRSSGGVHQPQPAIVPHMSRYELHWTRPIHGLDKGHLLRHRIAGRGPDWLLRESGPTLLNAHEIGRFAAENEIIPATAHYPSFHPPPRSWTGHPSTNLSSNTRP